MKWLGITLLLPLVISAQSITGKIVDPIPLPLQGVPVGLLPVGGDWVTKSTQTDSKGTFRFFPVEPGEYVLIARNTGLQSRVLGVRVVSGREVDAVVLVLRVQSCESPGVDCDHSGPVPPRPPVPVVDLCGALKAPDLYGRNLVVMVGMLTTLHSSPTLTATCHNALSSGGLTWTNSVLLPEAFASQKAARLPNIPNLKKQLADRAAALRKAGGSTSKSRLVAVYGFLDIPDGLASVPCAGDSCARPDILMPPASFLRVDGFQELK